MRFLSLDRSAILLITVLTAALLVLFSDYLILIIAAVILLFILLRFGEDGLVSVVAVIFMVISNEYGMAIRTMVQMTGGGVLGLLFLKHYGFSFSKYPPYPPLLQLFLAFFLFSMFLATFLSDYIMVGIDQIIRTVMFIAIIYFFFAYTYKERRYKFLIDLLILVAAISSLFSIFDLLYSNIAVFSSTGAVMRRIGGAFTNINNVAAAFAIAGSMSFISGYLADDRRKKRLYYSAMAIIVFGLFLTFSRAGMMALGISLAFQLFFLNRRLFTTLAFIAVFGFGLLLLISTETRDLLVAVFRIDYALSGRGNLWDTTLEIISDNWLTGVGPGAFKYEMYNYITVRFGTYEEVVMYYLFYVTSFGHSHHFYIFMLSELGIAGLISALFLPFVYLKIAYKTLRNYKELGLDKQIKLLYAVIGTGIAMFIRGFFESINLMSYGGLRSDLPFWLLFLILLQLYYKSNDLLEKNNYNIQKKLN